MQMMDAAAPSAAPEAGESAWWVVCLCAGWCGVCREYRSGFEALARRRPELRWHWLDVEDREDLVEDMDVETFPTLLIGQGAQAFFLGPLLPQHAVLERLVDSYIDGAPAAALLPAEATPLFLRIAKALA
ncbi:thioredoxin family protein [Comamonas sp. GB3 AK4-5]|uniref:thioredoxin family protein n=1 Tax=Comamonas sp. GB3 AK4-5 TaxID=3231487 RepID=UPI00351F3EDC